MTANPLDWYSEIWLADFEFRVPPGDRPEPVCMVAQEFRSGRRLRLWADDLARLTVPPFPVTADVLFVAFYASAELGCYLSLDWPLPVRILDLFTEFRNSTNGRPVHCGNKLLGVLTYFGFDGIDAAEKTTMQQLAMRGGPFTERERLDLLDYCESDVTALAKLLPAMLPTLDLPRALLRGRYMAAAACIEWNGVPMDVEALDALRPNWTAIKGRLVRAIDAGYGVFVPTGQRVIDPQSTLGAAILRTAGEWGIDPHRLADAVDEVWKQERSAGAELVEAMQAARRRTGLNARRIGQWEDAGHDSATYRGLDTTARELAGEFPALGIGPGYSTDAGPDDADHSGRLWQLLRNPAPKRLPKHDPIILRRAAELVTSAAAGDGDPAGQMTFSTARFAEWLARTGIPWPRLESGALDLSDDTFKQMARQYPAVAPLRELRHSLSQLRLNELTVGADERNRCVLWAFQARTGRNQPSNSKFIFGPSVWLRGLIRPARGRAVAYVDWEQQEFGIAAALSGDRAMMNAYATGDPYLAFAMQARAVPRDATKHSHKRERDQFKVCALAVQYGMGERSLALAVGQPEAYARELLRLHRQTYPTFWRWSQAAVDHAMLHGWLQTVFGWRLQVGPDVNPRSLANFPMQANGAEMLRLACCLATERGIQVCAPVHDAVLVEGTADEIKTVVEATQQAMREASEIVLAGFSLRTDAKIIRHPDRYADPRGETMWETVQRILAELATPERLEELVPF